MVPNSEGARLDHYRLGRKLGAGGMGEVFLATDLRLNRQVAIKFVTTARADDGLTERLLQEAQAVAALDHPCICPVFDGGRDADGRAYMVMPYLDGETLANRLAAGALAVTDALTICAQIADALACAHAGGIIHRDLKPQNVMLTRSGQLKLLDFGLAKLLPAVDRSESSIETTTALTSTHVLLGTPAYMAPEQIQRRPVDCRTDLFALGAILFECLTGRQAFTGSGHLEVLANILHGPVPSPAAVRGDVPEPVDDLCRRLLAKDPAGRFQSAAEVLEAIRRVQPAAGQTSRSFFSRIFRRPITRRRKIAYAAALLTLTAAIAVSLPRDMARSPSPAVREDALRWYVKGTEALRDGAFLSAATALEEAVRLLPQYSTAYARLAEARAEIDDDRAAQAALVRAGEQSGSSMPAEDRTRFDAVRALVLGDADAAVKGYASLAARRPADAGAWVDLGRAQERAGQLNDARDSYQRAIARDPQYAAGHLRLAGVDALQSRRDAALASLSEAERLYRASSNKEGETEVLIRRGALFDSVGEYARAKDALDRATSMAATMGNQYQLARARLHLSSVTASSGQVSDAEALALKAVQDAFEAGLQSTAAEGLIDLANALISAGRPGDAQEHLRKAADLAQRYGARRTAARAATQLASVQFREGKAAEALRSLEPALAFFRAQKYRRYELKALSIAARAHQQLDQLDQADTLARKVLAEAETTGDESQVSEALATLAIQAGLLGALPEALQFRQRAEAIHRRQQDVAVLPYDLTNKAEVLIQLGRRTDAAAALEEVEEGMQKKIAVYLGRERRVTFLRLLAATVEHRFAQALDLANRIAPGPNDNASVLGPVLRDYASVRLRRPVSSAASASPADVAPATLRELAYWRAVRALHSRKFDDAFAAATEGLIEAKRIRNDELHWRLAAIGAVAARQLGRSEDARSLQTQAGQSLARLQAAWGSAAREYLSRSDLLELRRAADLQL